MKCPVCGIELKSADLTDRFPRHGKVGQGPCPGSGKRVAA